MTSSSEYHDKAAKEEKTIFLSHLFTKTFLKSDTCKSDSEPKVIRLSPSNHRKRILTHFCFDSRKRTICCSCLIFLHRSSRNFGDSIHAIHRYRVLNFFHAQVNIFSPNVFCCSISDISIRCSGVLS